MTPPRIPDPPTEYRTDRGDLVTLRFRNGHASLTLHPAAPLTEEAAAAMRDLQDAGDFMSGHILKGRPALYRGRDGAHFIRCQHVDALTMTWTLRALAAGDATAAREYIARANGTIAYAMECIRTGAVYDPREAIGYQAA